MKNLFLAALLIFASQSFAASASKSDEGYVSWVVEKKSLKGEITLNRTGETLHVEEEVPLKQRAELSDAFLNFMGMGQTRLSSEMKFADLEENGVAQVKEFIAAELADDIRKDLTKLSFEAVPEATEVELGQVTCETKGFLKKRLECVALFRSGTTLNIE